MRKDQIIDWLHEPTARVLFYLLAMILVVEDTDLLPVNNRGVSNKSESYNRHFTLKANNTRLHDLVIFGNSPVSTDFSPRDMETVLPGISIYNFGFPALSMNPVLLSATEKQVNPTSKVRAILLGFTPNTLTEADVYNERYYLPFKNVSFGDLMLIRYTGGFDYFLPTSFALLHSAWHKRHEPKSTTKELPAKVILHDDTGWWEYQTLKETDDISREDYINKYKAVALRVSPRVMEDVFTFVRRWSGEGFRVFGIRMPLAPSLSAIADEVSGFDQNAFSSAFIRAGGIWLDSDLGGYRSVDGFHMPGEEARRFSRDTARELLPHLRHLTRADLESVTNDTAIRIK
ncbi:MAG: hypothetical protein HQL76_13305 [Magnetococcales bacterium]|nr:hypothetical protein [Magnetococcales bacterium]